MSYVYKKGYWETKDHQLIKIKDMGTSHIENAIKLLKRNPKFYDEEYGLWDFDEIYYDYVDNNHLVKNKIEEFEFELRLRKLERKDKQC